MRGALWTGLTALVVAAAATAVAPVTVDTRPSRATAAATTAATGYALPVPGGRVVAPFVAPAGPYSPGHRGVDLATPPHGPVHTAANGVVRFAGQVAGRGVVVTAHADGLVTEYEPVRPLVHAGESVRAGQLIGTVSGRHLHCAPDRCVHWAARRAGVYLDPMTLLAALGRVRLLPDE